ncbi:MAG TPA: PAS domain-containing protein [Thermoanaerobaculia bacterium]|nr:PAS domain-containing protein [Thermoanaerobaculia bacterium]
MKRPSSALACAGSVVAGVAFAFTWAAGSNLADLFLIVAVGFAAFSGWPALMLELEETKIGRKRSERLLRESEDRFRLLAQTTNDAVWDLDMTTGRMWRGHQFETLFGHSPDEAGPAAWIDHVHPDDRQRVRHSYHEAIGAGEPSWSDEYRFRRVDGTWAHVLDRCCIIRDSQKRPIRVLGAMMDMTEQKQMAEQLAQTRRVSSLGRMAASVAHEFNNVLMGMQPNLEVVRLRATEHTKAIDHILTCVQRGKRITEEILRFTRPAEPVLQCVFVRRFLDEWSAEIRPLMGSGIELSIEQRSPDLEILADPLQVSQMLTNLALNARDSIEGDGRISVLADLPQSYSRFAFAGLKTPDRYVHFTLEDTGTGMSPEQLSHIFEPLYTTKKHGTGLGLAVTYQIVNRHGGLIFAESEIGRGTTFHIFLHAALPDAINAGGPTVDSPATGAPRRSAVSRIVLVEDEQAVSAGIQQLFELEGVQVEVAETGSAAVPAIERISPDVVVLDIGLPDMSGAEVYQQIAKRWPALPVVISSGHAHVAHFDNLKSNVTLLMKPYDFATLLQTIHALTGVSGYAGSKAPEKGASRGLTASDEETVN